MAFQPNRTDLPVMVWLPQGGFISDATPLFQPEFLLAKDVVLVVLQHRLGVLGSCRCRFRCLCWHVACEDGFLVGDQMGLR